MQEVDTLLGVTYVFSEGLTPHPHFSCGYAVIVWYIAL
jgi:hypothetical protein